MSDRLSRSDVARLTGLSEAGVRWHIRAGNIEVGPDGRLSHADAVRLRTTRNVISTKLVERTDRLVRSRVRAGAIKLKRLKLRTEQLNAGTIERAAMAPKLQRSCALVLARIAEWPDRYAEQLAGELACDLAVARTVLQRFSTVALAELGDIEAEASAMLNRL